MKGAINFLLQEGTMDKERRLLLRILLLSCLLPILLFIHANLSSIRTGQAMLARYREQGISKSEIEQTTVQLEAKQRELQERYQEESSRLFDSDEITFYEFCDFMIDSAKNRGVTIKNYSTIESAEPKRLNITAVGSIRSILSYLQYLHTLDKKIDIAQLSISFNASQYEYTLSMMVNFITIPQLHKDSEHHET